MKLQNEINKVNALKSIIAEIKRVNHLLNYEFKISKADKLAHKVYNRMISFNHKYPKDAIKEDLFGSKNDPYGLKSYRSVNDSYVGDLLTSGGCHYPTFDDGEYEHTLIKVINPVITRCEFRVKQYTCTQSDINRANQYFKQNNVRIKLPLTTMPSKQNYAQINRPLTTAPIKAVVDSFSLNNLIRNITEAKGDVIAKKNAIKINSQWENALKSADSNVQINKQRSSELHDELNRSQNVYNHLLNDYRSDANLIKDLLNKIHEYRNSTVFVEYRHPSYKIVDLRPAMVSDLKAYTVKYDLFSRNYHKALSVLNSINYNDVDSSLDRIRRVISPFVHNDTNVMEFSNLNLYDLGMKTTLVRRAATRSIPYQRSCTVKDDYQTDQEFAKDKQNSIDYDKKVLNQIQNAGKYLDRDLKPYSVKTLKSTVKALKNDLLSTLFRANKHNANFNPQITVDQARITVANICSDDFTTRADHYKQRAKDLVNWIAKEYPNARISYRQLNPFGHYIYKRNIKNIKKALA